MRPLWKDVLTAVWLGMILPGLVLQLFVWKQRHAEPQQLPTVQEQVPEETATWIPVRTGDGLSDSMELDAYLTGVLLAEIPADFHMEALKAQAVAARTYTCKAYSTGGKHGDGSVCTDSACCQAYLAENAYLSSGGNQEDLLKIREAVQSTSGMVLVFDGELIEATYFSASGGHTEAAVAVWGADYPYLQVVTSPEETSPDILFFTREELESSLEVELSEDEGQWFGAITYTEGGGVASMEIGGQSFSGVQLRRLLGLRSTDFQMEAEDGRIKITTRGYGHRVGMSQYGANTMAEQGSTWQQILQHYYPGTNIVLLS